MTRIDDAKRSVDAGVTAISVSNHGGNNLDGTPATIRMLPDIARAVGDQVEVLMDGGVRRGGDVVEALALGARAVMIGRAYLWGLGANGQAGVEAASRRPLMRRFAETTTRSHHGSFSPCGPGEEAEHRKPPACTVAQRAILTWPVMRVRFLAMPASADPRRSRQYPPEHPLPPGPTIRTRAKPRLTLEM